MNGRKIVFICLAVLGLFLTGTVVVLATVQVYFGVDERDSISIEEANFWSEAKTLPFGSNLSSYNDTAYVEKVPRIVHQTWKDENLPEKWVSVREECIAMNPEFEYKLWTDSDARAFIEKYYAWFLDIYDNYPYPIQRADAMRYFILHHYGGVYMDLDIGCKRPILPLLNFDVILPRTIPVGISNDLMFAAPNHPFMELVIHNLVTFNHQYGTQYPTVMFSTGPMFLSAQYGLWPSINGKRGGIRVLPKALYGKNAKPEEAEQSFFSHFYGSSWHAGDAGFITFLGKFGMGLMYIGAIVLIVGCLRMVWQRRFKSHSASSGPISLPFSMQPPEFDGVPSITRAGYMSPASRPNSPSAYSRRNHAAKPSGALYWIPFYSNDGTPPYRPPTPPNGSSSHASWTNLLPSFFYDSNSNNYQPISPFSRPETPHFDSDNASLHSLHTIKASRTKALPFIQAHARRASGPDYPSSEDDIEAFAAPGYTPIRRPKPLKPSRADKNSRGLPPSYGNPWSSFTSMFRGSSGASPTASASTSAVLVPNEQKSGPLLSRQGSLNSLRSASPLPPGYESEAEVDKILSEMEDQDLGIKPYKQ